MDRLAPITEKVKQWLDELANTEGVLQPESSLHVARMAHEFGEPEELIRMIYVRQTNPFFRGCNTCVD